MHQSVNQSINQLACTRLGRDRCHISDSKIPKDNFWTKTKKKNRTLQGFWSKNEKSYYSDKKRATKLQGFCYLSIKKPNQKSCKATTINFS